MRFLAKVRVCRCCNLLSYPLAAKTLASEKRACYNGAEKRGWLSLAIDCSWVGTGKPMELRFDPIPIILNRGGPEEVLALLDEAGLLFTSLARENLLLLLSRQRRDGGLPSSYDPKNYGVRETGRAVRLFLHSGLGSQTLNVAAALDLLLEIQGPAGGWSENPVLNIPSSALGLSNTAEVLWLTAEIVRTLQEAGRDTEDAYWLALEWLYSSHCSGGGWPLLEGEDHPDPDTSTLVTFLMQDIYGDSDPVVQQGRLYYEQYLTEVAQDAQRRYYEVRGERHGLDVYHLVDTVLEPEAVAAGYDIEDKRVAAIVDAIVDIQRRDGGWRPFWGEESDPTYTLYALRALVWVGAMERSELAEMIRRHTN
jgi:hypothetical protein